MTIKRCAKLITWLLTFIMVFNMAPVFAFADDGDVISPVYHEGATLESSDPLGLNGKSGVLAIYENNKYTILTSTTHSTNKDRLVAQDISVSDGKKIIVRQKDAPTTWTITYSNGYYNLKSGNQYLDLSSTAKMSSKPYSVKIEIYNGKMRLMKTDGSKSVNLKSHNTSNGFQISDWTTNPQYFGVKDHDIRANELFEVIPVVISNNVTVQFSSNGAPNTFDSVEKEVGETITLPDYEGDYSGHELTGWKVKGSDTVYGVGEEYTLPDVVSITFTAVWEKRNTVTFSANGGDENAPAAATIKKNATSVILPDYNGKKAGYQFTGWAKTATPYAKDGTATAEIYSPGDEYTVQETGNKLYAVWTFASTVTVQFNSNGAPKTYEDLKENVGDEITLPDYDGDYLGHELTGWKMSGNNNVYSVNDQFTLPATEHVTFTAVWASRPTVIFDANGGSDEAPAASTIKDGMTSITLPDYNGTKEGYTFIGWADVSDIYRVNSGLNHRYHAVYKPGTVYTLKSGNNKIYAIFNTQVVSVQFGIRKDGKIQDEPNSYSVSDYIGHFKEDPSILKEARWVIDIDSTKSVNDYYLRNNITENLNWVPSAEKIAAALKAEGNVDFDPEKQYIHYYVIKSTGVGVYKIDGVIRNKANVEVSYNINVPAGTDKTKVTNMPGGYQVTPGTDILIGAEENSTAIKRPGINGYFFMGWNTKADGSGEYYHESTTVHLTENLNLYAQWIAEADNPLEIRITSDWTKGRIGYVGAKIKLTAAMTGFEGKQYTLQWQYSTDKETWYDVPDAHDETYTYILDETTTNYFWRVVAQDIR